MSDTPLFDATAKSMGFKPTLRMSAADRQEARVAGLKLLLVPFLDSFLQEPVSPPKRPRGKKESGVRVRGSGR